MPRRPSGIRLGNVSAPRLPGRINFAGNVSNSGSIGVSGIRVSGIGSGRIGSQRRGEPCPGNPGSRGGLSSRAPA